MGTPGREFGLGLVLVSLAVTLGLGLLLKTQPVVEDGRVRSPCAEGYWGDGRQYTRLCYSDIVPLFGTEQLKGGRLPYLDACDPAPGNCDEYPVLTMYAMRVAAWTSSGIGGFFLTNAVILAVAAFVIAVCLYLAAGLRALLFALAPTLLIYGFMNWDLLAVAFATAATLAYLGRRDLWSGILLGLGAAAKLYPALLVVPFALGRFREKEPDRAIHLAWGAAGSWLGVNLPFALLAPGSWWEFFRFNAERTADWDSLWTVGCQQLVTHEQYCGYTTFINAGSLMLFLAGSVLLWWLRRRRAPDFPRWTLGFPLLVVFLLTNKVYSPQYGLWLLPWFSLTLPGLGRFAAFSVADAAVFVTRFAFFGQLDGLGGWVHGFTIGWLQLALLVRAAVLVWCLAAWVRAPREEGAAAVPTDRAEAEAPA